MKDFRHREPFRVPEAPGNLPAFVFVLTVAGPDETPYPAEEDAPTVYYGRVISNVTYALEVGDPDLEYDETQQYVYFRNLVSGSYIEEGAVVCCVKLYNRYYTWDKELCQGCEDGPLYAIAGFGDAGSLRDVDNYNADSDVWKQKSDMPAPGRDGLVVVYGEGLGAAFAFGGDTHGGTDDDADKFVAPTDTWSSVTNLPAAVTVPSGAAVGTKAYVLAGDSGAPGAHYEYDPEGDSYTAKTAASVNATQRAGWAIGSGMHACGGFGSGATTVDDHERYTPGTNTWAARTALPSYTGMVEQAHAAAAVIGEKAYVQGGFPAEGNSCRANKEYDQAGNSWATKTELPLPARGDAAAAAVGSNVLLVGGLNYAATPGYLPDTLSFNPGANAWTTKSPLIYPRRMGHDCVSIV